MNALTFNLQDHVALDCRDWCVEERDTLFRIDLGDQRDGSDPVVEIPGRELIVNLFLWEPLVRRGIPIQKTLHLYHDEDFTASTLTKIHTAILWEVLRQQPETIQDLKLELIESIENLNNFINSKLNKFVYMLDIISIARTLTTAAAIKARSVDTTKLIPKGIKSVETAYKEAHKRVNEFFRDPNTKPNAFYEPLRLGLLNPTQFAQLVCAVGPRTDTDDDLVALPIQRSFIDGLEDIRAYAIESLAAKKSELYNAEEMPIAQYTNRKQQLNSSAICKIHVGDCGTDVTVKFKIQERFAKNVFGKYINDRGRVIALTEDNIHRFYDKTVDMYSVTTCRFQDGMCHKCGGMLAQYFFPPTMIPGIIAGAEVMSPLVQQVLSNKHMATTFATLYCVPVELSSFMHNEDNNIYLSKEIVASGVSFGVPYDGVKKLPDLNSLVGPVREDRYFSSIAEMFIANSETGELLYPRVPMTDKYKTVPYFSADFLEFIRNNPKSIGVSEDGGIMWVNVKGFDHTKPFLKAAVFNYSTKIFVAKIQEIFRSKVAGFTSITQYLEELSNNIWTRIHPNIIHLEVMGKASLITSPTNLNIPRVTDPDNVMFGKLVQLIPARSYGTQLAFEQFLNFISSPSTYLDPRPSGPFDPLVGFNDVSSYEVDYA